MTKEELREYRWLVKNIQEMEDELAELETQATHITSSLKEDVVDYTSCKDKMSGQVARIIELQDTINEQLARMYALQKSIREKIANMPEREKRLLTLKYIEGMTWEEVAVGMDYSWQHIHRLHSRALRLINKKMR
ncbi:MAG: hypothetical protein EOM00_16045 [Clostridia bacterium]|nr:hypothetical protein [Clostridia bacterium]